jgi:hypothetical protein
MVRYEVRRDAIAIDNGAIEAMVRTKGYVSGVAGGSFRDKKTDAKDLGFGLSVVDFLLEPLPEGSKPEPGQYAFGEDYFMVHGQIPKRYVEGPQICTQAGQLPYTVYEGPDFLALHTQFQFTKGYPPYRAGSGWEQWLIFPEGTRYFFSADRVHSVNNCPAVLLRVDMPGHIRHRGADSFEHVYLSYFDQTVPGTEFLVDFPPDGKFFYRRRDEKIPQRFYRAYQVRLGDRLGPWLAGMTLDPASAYEAWCHQRGYVCLIQEIGGRPVREGERFGAAYLIGWFDSLKEMNETYDRFRGWNSLEVELDGSRARAWRGVKAGS